MFIQYPLTPGDRLSKDSDKIREPLLDAQNMASTDAPICDYCHRPAKLASGAEVCTRIAWD